ncbi:MAG: cytochrome c [Vicinamibacterales bacterium]
MGSTFRILLAGSLTVWGAVVAAGAADGIQAKKTTNDGIYTTAQADGAKAQFEKTCAECHSFTVATKKKPKDKPLGDDPFFEEWTGRPVSELVSLIHLTMPDDGSADVTEEEAANLVAYVLQQNGYPTGSVPLAKDSAAIIERPVKK